MVVSKDPDSGRVMVLASGLLPIPMVRVDGDWSEGVFSADDLKDNFERVRDESEASTLFHEASAALSSNPGMARDPFQSAL